MKANRNLFPHLRTMMSSEPPAICARKMIRGAIRPIERCFGAHARTGPNDRSSLSCIPGTKSDYRIRRKRISNKHAQAFQKVCSHLWRSHKPRLPQFPPFFNIINYSYSDSTNSHGHVRTATSTYDTVNSKV